MSSAELLPAWSSAGHLPTVSSLERSRGSTLETGSESEEPILINDHYVTIGDTPETTPTTLDFWCSRSGHWLPFSNSSFISPPLVTFAITQKDSLKNLISPLAYGIPDNNNNNNNAKTTKEEWPTWVRKSVAWGLACIKPWFASQHHINHAQWCMPVIPALGSWSQEDRSSRSSLAVSSRLAGVIWNSENGKVESSRKNWF